MGRWAHCLLLLCVSGHLLLISLQVIFYDLGRQLLIPTEWENPHEIHFLVFIRTKLFKLQLTDRSPHKNLFCHLIYSFIQNKPHSLTYMIRLWFLCRLNKISFAHVFPSNMCWGLFSHFIKQGKTHWNFSITYFPNFLGSATVLCTKLASILMSYCVKVFVSIHNLLYPQQWL